jgi:hypothetical protein
VWRDTGAAARVLGEARAAAQRSLEGEKTQGEQQQEACELGRRGAIEHAVPDAVDGLGECPVPEGGHGAEIGEGLHHGQ